MNGDTSGSKEDLVSRLIQMRELERSSQHLLAFYYAAIRCVTLPIMRRRAQILVIEDAVAGGWAELEICRPGYMPSDLHGGVRVLLTANAQALSKHPLWNGVGASRF
eukprot:7026655-Pyramimonas_sp.AAC.1